jgi:DNA-binding NtrC family response regulator
MCVVPVSLPPLRARKDDVLILADNYIKHFCIKHDCELKELSSDVRKAFREYSWPGNVRELMNICEYAVVFSKGPLITLEDLQQDIFHSDSTSLINDKEVAESIKKLFLGDGLILTDIQIIAIKEIMKVTKGNKAEASRIIGISRETLKKKWEKLNRIAVNPSLRKQRA